MSAQHSDVPTETPDSDVDPTMEQQLIRRASQLCLRAEPHTDASPCAAHLAEAQRQLLHLPG
jgi:hypothetical protein